MHKNNDLLKRVKPEEMTTGTTIHLQGNYAFYAHVVSLFAQKLPLEIDGQKYTIADVRAAELVGDGSGEFVFAVDVVEDMPLPQTTPPEEIC